MTRRRPLLRAGLLVLAVVAGCTAKRLPPPTPLVQAAAATPFTGGSTAPGAAGRAGAPHPTAVVPRPARKPQPPTKAAAAAARAKPGAGMPTAPAALPSAALPASGAPDTLVGLDARAATALLGPPAETEEHPPATIWRYRGGGCTLELVFYLDGRSGELRSLREDLRGAGGDPDRRKACLHAIAEAGHPPGPAAR